MPLFGHPSDRTPRSPPARLSQLCWRWGRSRAWEEAGSRSVSVPASLPGLQASAGGRPRGLVAHQASIPAAGAASIRATRRGCHWLCPHCTSQTGQRGGRLWRVTRWLQVHFCVFIDKEPRLCFTLTRTKMGEGAGSWLSWLGPQAQVAASCPPYLWLTCLWGGRGRGQRGLLMPKLGPLPRVSPSPLPFS